MNSSIGELISGVVVMLAVIGAVFLIMPIHTTTADHWRQGEAACEVNGGVDGAQRHYDSLVVTCANGAQFTLEEQDK